MTNKNLAREAAEKLAKSHTWIKPGEAVAPHMHEVAVDDFAEAILEAIEASQVDVKGLVRVVERVIEGWRHHHKALVEGKRHGGPPIDAYYHLLEEALSAHPTSDAQCEAGMEEMGFQRVLPADVLGVLRELEWGMRWLKEDWCVCCGNAKLSGHKENCKLDALLKKYTSAPSLPAEALCLAYAIIEDAEADRFIYRTHETMMAGTKSYPLAKAVLKKYIPEETA